MPTASAAAAGLVSASNLPLLHDPSFFSGSELTPGVNDLMYTCLLIFENIMSWLLKTAASMHSRVPALSWNGPPSQSSYHGSLPYGCMCIHQGGSSISASTSEILQQWYLSVSQRRSGSTYRCLIITEDMTRSRTLMECGLGTFSSFSPNRGLVTKWSKALWCVCQKQGRHFRKINSLKPHAAIQMVS